LYGQAYRAVVVHSSRHDQRRQQPRERELQTADATLEASLRAAAKLRALQSAYHWVEGEGEEPPKSGPGRPRRTQPRVVKALRYGLQGTLHERSEVMARKRPETGGFVLLTNVPTADERAQRARAILRAYKEQHGLEQNYSFLQAPLSVNSLFLNKPEWLAALGLVLWLALLLWRLGERTRRGHVATTGPPLTGWDKPPTQKPTAFMRMPKCAAVMVRKIGSQRQLAPPLSPGQQQDLLAVGIPATYCTAPQSGSRDEAGKSRRQPPPRDQLSFTHIFLLCGERAHNTVHRGEIGEMLPPFPQHHRPGFAITPAPHKAPKLGNPVDGLP
jgi:hypothetical protein